MRIKKEQIKKYAKITGQLLMEILAVVLADKLKGDKKWK